MSEKKIPAVGDDWGTFKSSLLTREERDAIDLKVALITEMVQARHDSGMTQKELEEKSGVRQPIIARLEKGTTDPQLTTVLKLLKAFGKTLAIVPLK